MRNAWLLAIIFSLGCQNHPDEAAFGTTEYDVIRLTSTASETISAIPVHEGQMVAAGTVLIQLDTRRAEKQLKQAQAQLHLAESVLDELTRGNRKQTIAAAQAELTAARAHAHNSDKQAARAQALRASNALSLSDFETIISERDRTAAQLIMAQKNLELLQEGNRSEQLTQAQAQVDAAAAQLELQRQFMNELTIKAPADGQIDDLPYHVGERVFTGALLGSLLKGEQAYGRMYIPEQHRAALKIGDELMLHINGIEKPMQGKIRSIANEPAFTPYFALNQKERSRLVYLTEIELAQTENKIPAGLPVQWIMP
ncbi:MAG TPA: HlyD family efflux transporter periplasmic adaptor subunit [Cellvibrionaceae bacterium]